MNQPIATIGGGANTTVDTNTTPCPACHGTSVLKFPAEPPKAMTKPANEAWEAPIPPGIYTGYKDQLEERTSPRNGLKYTLIVFRVEYQGIAGRYAYYIGHHREQEAKAIRRRLAINPYARIRLIRKQGVRGLVVDEILPDSVTDGIASKAEAREDAWLS
jgi:hypothetical protein